MSPLEDALLLFAIVRRHLQVLQLGLDEAYPAEDWGFTAQQAVEKLLKSWIVLSNGQPPRVHDLTALAELSGMEIPPILLALQVYAVEARYEEGHFLCLRTAPRSWLPSSNCSPTASGTLRAES